MERRLKYGSLVIFALARAGAASQLFVENCPSVKRCDSGFAEQVGAETIPWWLRAVEAPSRKAREGAHPQFVNPNDHRPSRVLLGGRRCRPPATPPLFLFRDSEPIRVTFYPP
jgi:hypothetical protein